MNINIFVIVGKNSKGEVREDRIATPSSASKVILNWRAAGWEVISINKPRTRKKVVSI